MSIHDLKLPLYIHKQNLFSYLYCKKIFEHDDDYLVKTILQHKLQKLYLKTILFAIEYEE